MKLNKQLIIILVLGAFLLSAISIAVYLYIDNNNTLEELNQKVKVYIVNKPIKAGHQFTKDDLKEHFISKQELLYNPLGENEIIGKYSRVDMFENEMIIKDKVNNTMVTVEMSEPINPNYKSNSYNMSFSLFQNPNYTLKKGDIINIVSTYPLDNDDKSNKHSVQYVAKNIEVLGFITLGRPVGNVFEKVKMTRNINKNDVVVEEDLRADEIVLDVPSDIVLNIISDYNRGKQLWMVLTKSTKKSPTEQTDNQQDNKDGLVTVAVVDNTKKFKSTIEYKYRWYVPTIVNSTKTARVEYANTTDVHEETVILDSNNTENCLKKQSLIETTGKVKLRVSPTPNDTIQTILGAKAILPYSEKIGEWYKTCDDLYVHQRFVKELTYEEAVRKINENK